MQLGNGVTSSLSSDAFQMVADSISSHLFHCRLDELLQKARLCCRLDKGASDLWFLVSTMIMMISHVDDQAPQLKDCPAFSFWWWNKRLNHCYRPGLRPRLGYFLVHCHQHLRNHRVEGAEQSIAQCDVSPLIYGMFDGYEWIYDGHLMDMIEWDCPKDWEDLRLLEQAFSPTTINTGKGTEFEGAIVALSTPQDHWAHSITFPHVYQVWWTTDQGFKKSNFAAIALICLFPMCGIAKCSCRLFFQEDLWWGGLFVCKSKVRKTPSHNQKDVSWNFSHQFHFTKSHHPGKCLFKDGLRVVLRFHIMISRPDKKMALSEAFFRQTVSTQGLFLKLEWHERHRTMES